MKRKLHSLVTLIAFTTILFTNQSAHGQCTWHNKIFDSFEYSTPCPDLIAITTYGTTPQTYVHHSGAKALYMNFRDAGSGPLCDAGTVVYSRTINVCAGIPIRVSAWLTETNGPTKCNMKVKVTDANDVVLDSAASIVPSAVGAWVKYQSPSVTPTTSTIKFILITNLAGSAVGNDAGMDDLLVEECNDLFLGNDTSICNTGSLNLDAGSGFNSYVWSNSSTTQSITASTIAPGTTSAYYKVTVVAPNTCSYVDSIRVTFDVCASVNSPVAENQISVYPNPSVDYLFIRSDAVLNNSYFILYDALGQEALRSSIESKMQRISVASLSNGIYFYKMYEGNRLQDTGKLMVGKEF